jgi:hypothetical protein
MSTSSDAIRSAAQPLLPFLPERAWLPHGLVRKPDGGLDKPPREGATTDNPASWFTLVAALDKLTGTNSVAGIGFAIVKRLITLDFDHCRDQFTGELNDEVQTELERCNSFAYVTPSKTGIRIVGLNDTFQPIPGGKRNRWTAGRQKIEIFVGPTNHYNTFTPDLIPGYTTIRDISDVTLDYLQFLDPGRKSANGSAPVSNPDPQRSIAAIRAALVIIPNPEKDWDEWNRIGMAVWRASGGSGAGLDAWSEWSAKHPCNGRTDSCDARWQHYFESPPTKIGFGSLYYEARKIRPLFVPPFDPIPDENGGDGKATEGDLPFEAPARPRILTMRQLDALPPPEWLVDGLIPEKSLVVPFGPPKAGKTFVVLSWALHVAAGAPWFGRAVKQGAVVYIAGEGTGGLSLRLRAMRAAYDISVDAPLFVVPRAVNFRLESAVADLVALVRVTVGDMTVAMVVIDTLARAMPGADENSAQEVGLVIAGCDLVRDTLGCTVVPIHHSGKDVARGARGTSALRGAWDTALEIAGSGKRVTMTVVDQKEAEAGQRLVFRMDTVAVGIGRTSLVPMLNEAPNADQVEKECRRPEPGGQAGMMLRTLRDLMAGPESAILPPFSDLPSGDIRGLSVLIWRRGVYEKMPTVEADARRQAFGRGLQTLMQKNLINVKDPWVWLCDRNEA